jgi:hypothetical protein
MAKARLPGVLQSLREQFGIKLLPKPTIRLRVKAEATQALDAKLAPCSTDCNVGVPVTTVRRWLRDAREGREPYVTFAVAADGARSDRQRVERALKHGPLTPEEAELLLAKAARKGSVPALRLWFSSGGPRVIPSPRPGRPEADRERVRERRWPLS